MACGHAAKTVRKAETFFWGGGVAASRPDAAAAIALCLAPNSALRTTHTSGRTSRHGGCAFRLYAC
eukprot:66323-Prymnesium_polylepis.1